MKKGLLSGFSSRGGNATPSDVVTGDTPLPAYLQPYLPTAFCLFWHVPVRAHVGVDVNFRPSHYHYANLTPSWTLTNAPAWMVINSSTGLITGTPTVVATHSNIILTVICGGYSQSRTFTLTVYAAGSNRFMFVDFISGNDANAGTLVAPKKHLYGVSGAFTAVRTLHNNPGGTGPGCTIYIRGTGIHQEAGEDANLQIYQNYYTESDPLEIRGYPGETAIIDCAAGGASGGGRGPWILESSYVVYSNLTIRNPRNRVDVSVGIFGGFILEKVSYGIFKDCICYGARRYAADNDNAHGFYIRGKYQLVDRCVAYDNRQADGSTGTNDSNFYTFTNEGVSAEYIWIQNCKSWGSGTLYKIKMAGSQREIVHNCEGFTASRGTNNSADAGGVRYCVFKDCDIGILHMDNNDVGANPFIGDGAHISEHVTIINSSSAALAAQAATRRTGPFLNKRNLHLNNVASISPGANRMWALWTFSAFDATLKDFSSEECTFASLLNNAFLEIGTIPPSYSSSRYITLADLQSPVWDKDIGDTSFYSTPSNVYSDAAITAGTLNLTGGSVLALSNGGYVGAFKPGVIFGTVAQQNTNLINWNVL